MFTLKQLNRKLFNYLNVVLLVATFLIFPPALTHQLPFLSSSSPAVTSSVNAQTTQPKNRESKSSDSQKPDLPLNQEETEAIDFFKMAMGATAGLVLFIYGVTRLAEGLESERGLELSTEKPIASGNNVKLKNIKRKTKTHKLNRAPAKFIQTLNQTEALTEVLPVLNLLDRGL